MPDLTQNEIAMLAKGVRPGGKLPKNSKPVGETSAEVDAFVTTVPTPPPPKPPRDHFDGGPVGRVDFVALAKKFFPTESAEFTDEEIGDSAQHYMDDTLAEQMRMVGLHMKDRLDQRADGKPHFDDSKGRAAAEAAEG